MLKIVTAPNPVLSKKTEPVKKINNSILKLIEEMKQTLLSAKDPEGVGLAAPQVGQPLRLFIVKSSTKSPIQTFINPTIIIGINPKTTNDMELNGEKNKVQSDELRVYAKSNDKETKLEGCLSLPNIWGVVERKPQITLSYLDEKGKLHNRKFTGFMATIIQHEMDHLEGILFPKHVLEQKEKLYKSYKNEKGEDEFEEITI